MGYICSRYDDVMFRRALVFSQDLSMWNVGNVTTYSGFNTDSQLSNAQLPNFPT